jgi:hypothetical protein
VVKSNHSFSTGKEGFIPEAGKRGQLPVSPVDKPLPPLPNGVSDTRTLQTDVSIGFPKRPRRRTMHHERHPPLDVANSLPDGLYKGKLKLEKHILPSLDWAGLSVKVSRSGFQPSIRIADYSSSISFKSQFFLVKMNFVPGSRYAYYGPLKDGPEKAFTNSKDSFTLFILISISTWKLLPNRPHTCWSLLYAFVL